MAISSLIYNNTYELKASGTIGDIEDEDALGMLLLEVDDDGNETTQRSRLTVTAILSSAATELRGDGGYERQNLVNVDVFRDDTNDRVDITADDVDFGPIARDDDEEIVAVVIYKEGASDGDRIPLMKVTATAGDIIVPNGEAFFVRFQGSSEGSGGVAIRLSQLA